MATNFKLTYFNIHGLAEKVRLAFVLQGIEFEDVRIEYQDWPGMKPSTKFGQLPLLELELDGKKHTFGQSDGLLRYVGGLGDGKLYPSDPLLRLSVDEMVSLAGDMQNAWTPCLYVARVPEKFGYPKGYQETDEGKALCKKLREDFLENTLPLFMDIITKQLQGAGGFLCSKDEPTIADCALVVQLRQYQRGFIDHVPTTSLDKYPEVTAYISRFLSHKKVAAWYAKSEK